MTKWHALRLLLLAGSTGCLLLSSATAAQNPAPAAAVRPAGPASAAPKAAPTPPPKAPTAAEISNPPANAKRLPSGVATVQLRAGTGAETPRAQDMVAFRSIGRRTDGSVVMDGFAAKDPGRAVLSNLHAGWQEGLREMRVGEQRRFWFPAEAMPPDPKSGVREPVVFDIELVGIGRLPNPPASLTAPDPKAKKIGSGTSVLVLKPGQAGKTAARTDAALTQYTLWNPQGKLLGASAVDGRPTLFPLDKVMPSFADCLDGMAIGERRNCWIPALHNDGFPGAPTGDLIFEVELLRFIDLTALAGGQNPPAKP